MQYATLADRRTRGDSCAAARPRGEIFGDEAPAAAMIDRLVRDAEILALNGVSYRLKDRDLARTTLIR